MAAPRQPELQRCRELRPSTTPPVQPAPFAAGPSSDPHITLSPQTPTGLRTVGFAFMIVSTGQGTVVRVWKRDPISKFWGLLVAVTALDFALFTWITVCDVNASELFFETDTSQDPGILVEEIGYGA